MKNDSKMISRSSNHNSSGSTGPGKQTAVLRRALAHFVSAFRDRTEAKSQALALVEEVIQAVDQVSAERESFRKVVPDLFALWAKNATSKRAYDAVVAKLMGEQESSDLADWYFETDQSTTREAEIRADIFDFARNEHAGEHHDLKSFRGFVSDVLQLAPES